MSGLRKVVGGLLVVAVFAVGLVVMRSDDDGGYRVAVRLDDAGGLLKGANVRVDGVPVGKVVALDVNGDDEVAAELKIDDASIHPIGRDARVVVQVDGIFGERYAELERGDTSKPMASGGTIPVRRSSVSVRLDDVLDTADLPTREALAVFLNEQGLAVNGRGRDLGSMLKALPPSLDSAEQLVADFSSDNRALGRLIEESDRVVGEVARERPALGRFVQQAGGTLDTLASRRRELGETVRRAPATLASARRALTALDGAARPLVPAARGLRATAPRLNETLSQVPRFSRAADPTLTSIRRLAPQLDQLATRGTPIVRRLEPLTRQLTTYAGAANPFFRVLDQGSSDLFGVMEGWARATQGRDAASHVFRFGASTSTDTFGALLGGQSADRQKAGRRSRPGAPRQRPDTLPAPSPQGQPQQPAPAPGLPDVKPPKLPDVPGLPKLPGTQAPQGGDGGGGPVQHLLDYLLGP